jgi:hypothetical protein
MEIERRQVNGTTPQICLTLSNRDRLWCGPTGVGIFDSRIRSPGQIELSARKSLPAAPQTRLRDEGATYAIGALLGALRPHRLEANAHRRKDRHMEYRQNILREFFGRVHLDGHTAEA